MMKAIKRICTIIGLFVCIFPAAAFAQEGDKSFESFVELFPEHYLPFSIAENDLTNIDKTSIKAIPEEYLHYLPQNFSTSDFNIYAYASIKMANGKIILFHLEESVYPFVRKVFISVFSEEGFPEATELFASYEKGLDETYTYAIVNQKQVIHRTTKNFLVQKNEIKIKTDKFRLNSFGEIVAL